MYRIECNLNTGEITQIALTPEEIAEIAARPVVVSEPTPAPTKEQLMTQLAALSAQIQALE
jgi:ribosomal protein S10